MLKLAHATYLAVIFLFVWTAVAQQLDFKENPDGRWEDHVVEEQLQGHYAARRLVNDSNEEDNEEEKIMGLDKKFFLAIVIAGPFLLIPCCCYAAHFCQEKRKGAPYESETEKCHVDNYKDAISSGQSFMDMIPKASRQ